MAVVPAVVDTTALYEVWTHHTDDALWYANPKTTWRHMEMKDKDKSNYINDAKKEEK